MGAQLTCPVYKRARKYTGCVPASRIHLVRHGEVHNPEGVLYGRIPGFHLSELGHRMAEAAAAHLEGRDITRLYASPLQRTQESAAPWAERFQLDVHTDDRLIEPFNKFEGKKFPSGTQLLGRPEAGPWELNPMRPSWGEAFVSIATRMLAVIEEAHVSTERGEAVLVSHQLPIWMVARTVARKPLPHDPRQRRCALSSITTFERRNGRFVEVGYRDPAARFSANATDLGAV